MRLETSAWCAPGIACALLALQGACTLQDFDSLGTEWGAGAGGAPGGGGGAAGDVQGGAGPDAGALGGSGGSGGSGEPPTGNLIENPSFESGHRGWTGFGASTVSDVSTTAHTGSRCIASKDRQEAWMGPSYDATDVVSPGKIYRISAWVRMETEIASIALSYKSNCGANDIYSQLANVEISTEWTLLEASMPVPNCDPLYNLSPYFEGPPPGAVFYVDDVALELIP